MTKNRNIVILKGTRIYYHLKKRTRDPFYLIRFKGPSGKWHEKSTKTTNAKTAHLAAETIIQEMFLKPAEYRTVTWEESLFLVKEEFQKAGLRERTQQDYIDTLQALRKVLCDHRGPATITTHHVDKFLDQKRKEGRRPHTLGGYIRKLGTLWKKYFIKQLKIVETNPWESMKAPKTDRKRKRILTSEEERHFFQWLLDKFKPWRLPYLFCYVKSLIGCRITELCELRPEWLRDGKVHFPEDKTKGREARVCRLPKEVFEELQIVSGREFVWESYSDGLKLHFQNRGSHFQRNINKLKEFAPKRLKRWLQDLCVEYNSERKKKDPGWRKFTLHNFRGSAMTKYINRSDGDYQSASIAFDCEVETIKAHYAEVDNEAIADKVFTKLQEEVQIEEKAKLKELLVNYSKEEILELMS